MKNPQSGQTNFLKAVALSINLMYRSKNICVYVFTIGMKYDFAIPVLMSSRGHRNRYFSNRCSFSAA